MYYNTAAGCSFGMCGWSDVSAGTSTQLWKMLWMVSCCGKAYMVEGAFRKAEKFPRREEKLCAQGMKWLTSAEWLQRERAWRDAQSTPRNGAGLAETLAFYLLLCFWFGLWPQTFFQSVNCFIQTPSTQTLWTDEWSRWGNWRLHTHSQEQFLWNSSRIVSQSCKTNLSAMRFRWIF